MKGSLQFRLGTAGDFDALLKLGHLAFSEFEHILTPENWRLLNEGLLDEDRLHHLIEHAIPFVCEADGVITGVVYYVPSGNPEGVFEAGWCYIRRVAVHPSYRGLGISHSLTSLCINYAMETNEKVMALHTAAFMHAAHQVYQSLGFVKAREIDPIFGKRYWLYLKQLT